MTSSISCYDGIAFYELNLFYLPHIHWELLQPFKDETGKGTYAKDLVLLLPWNPHT